MEQSTENGRIARYSVEERCSDNEAEAQLQHVKLIKKLNVTSELHQMNTFFEYIIPDPEENQRINDSIKNDLKDVLSRIFPPFTILELGSSVSKLQFNGSSDYDLHIYFEKEPKEPRKCVFKAATALSKSDLFGSVRGIYEAKIPLVEFVHVETGMKCDVNFSHVVGVENSRLMRYYLSLDDKVRFAMLIIKYWGLTRGIILKYRGFSKYSLVMMLVFYLQQHFSFPSVCMLQQKTEPTIRGVKWNTNFIPMSNLNRLNAIKSASIVDILIGFFKYYADFKYDIHIISPYLGHVIQKSYLKRLDSLECQSKLPKLVKHLNFEHCICVQDPFELDRNTCSCSKKMLMKFVSQCAIATEILSRKRTHMFIDLISPIEKPDSYLNVPLHMTTNCLETLRKNNAIESDDELVQMWFRNTLNFCNAVFKEVLKFNVESEEHSKTSHSYIVSSPRHLWLNRDRNIEETEDLAKYGTNLNRERAISNFISENIDYDPSEVPEFKCFILISYIEKKIKERSTMVEVEFIRKVGKEELFESFTRYMSENLVFWFYESKN